MQTVDARTANQPVLSVKRRLWRKDDDHAEVTTAAFNPVRQRVLQRDNHTCRFCGFRSEKWQELHHLDDNHQNNAVDNLVVACNLCHQVHHLGMCAMNSSGFIAAVPELTQTEINHIIRALFVAERLPENAAYYNKLQSLYAIFQYRGQDTLKSLFGLDISSPFILVDVLANCPDDIYADRAERFKSLRLIAAKEAFQEQQLADYASAGERPFAIESWLSLAERLAAGK